MLNGFWALVWVSFKFETCARSGVFCAARLLWVVILVVLGVGRFGIGCVARDFGDFVGLWVLYILCVMVLLDWQFGDFLTFGILDTWRVDII